MDTIFESCMNQWVRMLNENRFTPPENPDDYKADKLDVESERYEQFQDELKTDVEKYFKEVRKTGKLKGLKEEEEIEKTSDEEVEKKTKKVETEAMSATDIMAKFAKDNEGKIDSVVIKSFTPGGKYTKNKETVVVSDIKFKDGNVETKTFNFEPDAVNKVFKKLQSLFKDQTPTLEDAVTAIIRKKIDPNDTLEWYYHNTKLDDWIGNDLLKQVDVGSQETVSWDYGANKDDEEVEKRETSVYGGAEDDEGALIDGDAEAGADED